MNINRTRKKMERINHFEKENRIDLDFHDDYLDAIYLDLKKETVIFKIQTLEWYPIPNLTVEQLQESHGEPHYTARKSIFLYLILKLQNRDISLNDVAHDEILWVHIYNQKDFNMTLVEGDISCTINSFKIRKTCYFQQQKLKSTLIHPKKFHSFTKERKKLTIT